MILIQFQLDPILFQLGRPSRPTHNNRPSRLFTQSTQSTRSFLFPRFRFMCIVYAPVGSPHNWPWVIIKYYLIIRVRLTLNQSNTLSIDHSKISTPANLGILPHSTVDVQPQAHGAQSLVN
jgi:hypothetical protein